MRSGRRRGRCERATRRGQSVLLRVLGLPFLGTDADGKLLFGLAGGGTLALIDKPAGSQAAHTALSFEVDDIGASIQGLQAHGVAFDDFSHVSPAGQTTEITAALLDTLAYAA